MRQTSFGNVSGATSYLSETPRTTNCYHVWFQDTSAAHASAKLPMKNVEFVSREPEQESEFNKTNKFHNYAEVGVSSDARREILSSSPFNLGLNASAKSNMGK